MTRDDLLRELEGLIEVQPGTLHGPEELASLPGWDSMVHLDFVVSAERATGRRPSLRYIANCRTVEDLLSLFKPPAKEW
jgi:hypothetical protein